MEDENQQSLDRALSEAAKAGDVPKMAALTKAGANVNANDPAFNPPLCNAVWFGQEEAVKYLLEKGAEVDIQSRHDHDGTPLQFAANANRAEMVSLLLSFNADTQLVSRTNMTARGYAEKKGYSAVARILQEAEERNNITFRRRIGDQTLEESFNFIQRERVSVLWSKEWVAQIMLRDTFADIPQTALREAFAEHTRRGGRSDECSLQTGKNPAVRILKGSLNKAEVK